MVRRAGMIALIVLGARQAYRLLARGSLTIDTGVGRRSRPLGPVDFTIAAPREFVFDLIASPYLGRTPRAFQDELAVWERGTDMVLAAHYTQLKCGVTTTLETVRFDRPAEIAFRVVRGPVPHVAERFLLEPVERGTRLRWQGELGTDFWALGAWWGDRVARHWERRARVHRHGDRRSRAPSGQQTRRRHAIAGGLVRLAPRVSKAITRKRSASAGVRPSHARVA